MRSIWFILLFFSITSSKLVAQKPCGIKPLWLSQKAFLDFNTTKINLEKFIPEKNGATISENNLCYKHVVPAGAIFCRMEDVLYSRSNVWFKIRAGTDEWYNSVIKENEKSR